MERTNQDIWDEVLRTAELLKQLEPTLESMEKAAAKQAPVDMDDLPVNYVSDAQILTHLVLLLKSRDARIS